MIKSAMNRQYTQDQIVQLCRNMLAMSDEYDKRVNTLNSLNAEVLPWVQQVGSWGWLYTKPFDEFSAKLFAMMGMNPDQIFGDPGGLSGQTFDIEALEAQYEEPPDPHGIRLTLSVPMTLAMQGHVRAMDMFNQTMDELLLQAANGDDKALFKAVLVDPVVLTAFPAQSRFIQAALMKDDSFFQSLAKALTHKKPIRPAKKYDPIRFLIGSLDSLQALDGVTQDEICRIFIDELGLYPHDSGDPYAGLKKFIQNIRSPEKK
ncbi:MAG: hypothetical protein V7721_11735 [Porticoccaceae bacterium]